MSDEAELKRLKYIVMNQPSGCMQCPDPLMQPFSKTKDFQCDFCGYSSSLRRQNIIDVAEASKQLLDKYGLIPLWKNRGNQWWDGRRWAFVTEKEYQDNINDLNKLISDQYILDAEGHIII